MTLTMNNRFVRFLLGIWLPILLIYLWWTISATSENPYFPPLEQIWEQFKFLWVFDNIPTNLVPTLQNLFVGLAIGISSGVLIGAHLGLSKYATRMFMPIIDFVRSIPSIAKIPIFIMFFGIDSTMRVAVIAFVTCFPVMIATIQAVRSTDPTLVDTGKVFRLSGFQMLWKVRLPSASPQLFASFQLAVQIGFLIAIGAEILGAGFGLGAFTKIAQDSFLIVDMWTGVILMGIVGYLLFLAFEIVERITLRWYYGAKKLEN